MLPIAALVYLVLILAVVLQGRGARRELVWGALLAALLVTGALLWERFGP